MENVVFKRVNARVIGFKLFRGLIISFEECEKVITEQEKLGYEYKGFVPIELRGKGEFSKIDLIFKKEII